MWGREWLLPYPEGWGEAALHRCATPGCGAWLAIRFAVCDFCRYAQPGGEGAWGGDDPAEVVLLAAQRCDTRFGWWLVLGRPNGELIPLLAYGEVPRSRVEAMPWGRPLVCQPQWGKVSYPYPVVADYRVADPHPGTPMQVRTIDMQKYGCILDGVRRARLITAYDAATRRWFLAYGKIHPEAEITLLSMAD